MNNNTVQHDARESAINTTLVRVEERAAYKDLPMDRLSNAIEEISVDGRPAHPEMGPRRIRRLVASLVAVILTAGMLVALLVDPAMGFAVAAFGVVLFVADPELWATLLRARERRQAQRQLERTTPPRRTGRRWRPNGHALQIPRSLARSRADVPALQGPAGVTGSGENTTDVFIRWNA